MEIKPLNFPYTVVFTLETKEITKRVKRNT